MRERRELRFGFVFVELSGVRIGEPLTGVWCATCNLPSAVVQGLAVLVKKMGEESYECDPVIKVLNVHACEECHSIFEMADSPCLINGSLD
jgi:hypothetical protein